MANEKNEGKRGDGLTDLQQVQLYQELSASGMSAEAANAFVDSLCGNRTVESGGRAVIAQEPLETLSAYWTRRDEELRQDQLAFELWLQALAEELMEADIVVVVEVL